MEDNEEGTNKIDNPVSFIPDSKTAGRHSPSQQSPDTRTYIDLNKAWYVRHGCEVAMVAFVSCEVVLVGGTPATVQRRGQKLITTTLRGMCVLARRG